MYMFWEKHLHVLAKGLLEKFGWSVRANGSGGERREQNGEKFARNALIILMFARKCVYSHQTIQT